MSPAEILENAAQAARGSLPLAAAWHVALLAAMVALRRNWRPSRRAAGLLLAAPVLSASASAWVWGNPFNGTVLLIVSTLLARIAVRLPAQRVEAGAPWARAAGIALIALAWVYPHFLEQPALYAFAAPLGVLPCPTLCAVTGLSLFAGGLSSRAWAMTVALPAGLYGAFGAVRLGVTIDLALFAGALALAATPHRVRARLRRGAT